MSNKIRFCDIQNFQGFTRARIPLSDFNIIVGPSRSGKTTIFRAMQFLLYGEWDHTFPHDESKAVAVGIEFENGTRIIRLRKDNVNSAAIISNGNTVKYKSFGSIIPGLRSYLNVEPIEVGNASVNLNFSMQDDPIFMVSESRPTKAQWIGRLYGAHIINEMMRSMAKDKKVADAKHKDKELEVGKLQAELAGYASLKEQNDEMLKVVSWMGMRETLLETREERETLGLLKKQMEKDSWISSFDADTTKVELYELRELRKVAVERDEVLRSKDRLGKLATLTGVNFNEITEDLELLTVLSGAKAELLNLKSITGKNAQVSARIPERIGEIKQRISDEVIKENKCPLCGQDSVGHEAHIIANMAELVKPNA